MRVCVRGGGECGVEVAFFFCCEEQREREGERCAGRRVRRQRGRRAQGP